LLWDSWESKYFDNLRDSNSGSFDFFSQSNTKCISQDSKNHIPDHNNTVASSSKLVPIVLPSLVVVPLVSSSNQNLAIIMADRYAPLVLPANLHDLPQGYAQHLKQFGAEGDVTAQQHFDRFLDFCYLEEIDYEDVRMRLFAQSLLGEVKKWFRLLPVDSIPNFQHFERLFLSRWEEKKNPVQLLTQYNQLKRGNDEAVRNFLDKYNRIYNAFLAQCKPPEGMAKLHYTEGFDYDFSLLQRERRSTTLAEMMDDSIEVEVNLMASKKGKYRFDNKKVKEESQPSTSQSASDAKFEFVLRTMERMMERFSESDRKVVREQHEPIIRNPNFRNPRQSTLPPPPQILPRGQRNQIQNQTDQVRPPFQENLLDDEYAP
jgi:hypothetical protein